MAGMTAMAVAAQEVEAVAVEETETVTTSIAPDARSNWFISAGAGAQVFFGDHDRQAKLGDRIAPALDVAVGKWFSPNIGLRLMWSGLQAKGATQTWGDPNGGAHSTGKEVPGKFTNEYGYLCKSKFNMFTLHVDVLLDLTNIIGGYKPNRVYGIAPYIGVGWGHVYDSPVRSSVVGNIGILNMFHVGKALDINLDVRGSVMDDKFDGQTGRRDFEGLLTVTAGLTYRFAPRGWKTRTMREVVYEYDNDAVNALRAQVDELENRNDALAKEVAAKGKVKTVAYSNGSYLIYFPINVSTLSEGERAQLEQVAKMIKETPEGRFNVVGYADKATGNAEVNDTLSRERAESVKDCLVNEFGVSADRLNVVWKGGVGNMFFDNPALSRVVIISPAK